MTRAVHAIARGAALVAVVLVAVAGCASREGAAPDRTPPSGNGEPAALDVRAPAEVPRPAQAARPSADLVAALDEAAIRRILRHGPLGAPEPDPTNRVATSDAAAHLGQRLFYDPRLSLSTNHSCASCHMPTRAFADGLALPSPPGSSERHSPTLLNVAHQRWFFWDGRADSLWSQALHVIENPKELGIGRAGLAQLLARDPLYRAEFEAAFGRPPSDAPDDFERTAVDAAKAIAAYEMHLSSGDSAFDRFEAALAQGDLERAAEYPPDALRGLLLFTGRANCRSCHAGPLFSDGEFHTIGFPPAGGGKPRDPGRMRGVELVQADPLRGSGAWSDAPDSDRARDVEALVRSAEQWGQFRTPTLRNVARTAPYMSQGQVATLREILVFYSTLEGAVAAGHHGETVLQPLGLAPGEIDDLEAFLRTLDGVDPPPERLWAPPRPR